MCYASNTAPAKCSGQAFCPKTFAIFAFVLRIDICYEFLHGFFQFLVTVREIVENKELCCGSAQTRKAESRKW